MIKYNVIKTPNVRCIRSSIEDNSIESMEWVPIEPDISGEPPNNRINPAIDNFVKFT